MSPGLEVDRLEAVQGPFRLGPVRLAVAPGTATVLLGPSGAGKTTLLRAIAGFVPRTSGSVRLDGRSIDELPPERRGLGFVPPDLGLFAHRRVRRNVSYPLELAGAVDAARRTREWLARFDLERLAERYPAQLSSGERQRVAMARALIARPRLLLWDEPLAALDVESRDGLLRLLRDLLDEEAVPLLLVTHDPSTALSLAARLVVLEAGRVRFDGPPGELAEGRLDRFTARFLGYENLYSPGELALATGATVHPALAQASGPDGVVVPSDAVRFSGPRSTGATVRVQSVRWTAAGWVLAFQDGGLTLHAAPSPGISPLRVGDRVDLALDADALKPLERVGAGDAP